MPQQSVPLKIAVAAVKGDGIALVPFEVRDGGRRKMPAAVEAVIGPETLAILPGPMEDASHERSDAEAGLEIPPPPAPPEEVEAP